MGRTFFQEYKPALESALFRFRDDCFAVDEYEHVSAPIMNYGHIGSRSSGYVPDNTANFALHNIDPPEDIKHKKKWIGAISAGMEHLQQIAPEKAILIDRFYGLTKVIRYQNQPRKMMILICSELNISEPTAYRWRLDALMELMVFAIYYGALRPLSEKKKRVDTETRSRVL